MSNLSFVNPKNDTSILFIANFIYYKKGGKSKMEDYREEVVALQKKYQVTEMLTINVNTKEAIVGANTMEQPDEISIQMVSNTALFNSFIEDSEYQKLKVAQEEAIHKMTYVVGTEIENRKMSSDVPFNQRIYALGMIYYKPDGQQKLREFTGKAIPLFMKHSFYAYKFINILDKGALIGEADDFTLPQELRIFWADSPQDLENYNSDPDYHAIKSIREEGIADYPTFLGTYQE